MSGIIDKAAKKSYDPIHNPEGNEDRVGSLSPNPFPKLKEILYTGMTDV
jgi:hypothetical protein